MYYGDECETCGREFVSGSAAVQHMNALDHWGPRFDCDTCDREFLSQRAADQHMNDTGHHKPQFECDTCTSRFHTQTAANQHMEALGHWEHYCQSCKRQFVSANNLKMHLNSAVHRGKTVAFPFCRGTWTTASGLSHHLETGSCPNASNVDHRTIFRAISQRDPGGLITNKLITFPDTDIENIATQATWNGSRYECYLCHRKFVGLRALNQHLGSPAHSEKLYHCPNRSCNGQYVRLAALFNHLESESCKFVRFEKVQNNVQDFMTGRHRLISFG